MAISAIGLLTGLYILALPAAPEIQRLPPLRRHAVLQVERKLQAAPGVLGDRLYISRIGVDVAIVTGANEASLSRGAWHRRPENGDPRKGGNFVLSAHRFQLGLTPQGTAARSPFYRLNDLRAGDLIQIDYQGQRYIYTVERLYKVKPNEAGIEAPSATAKLTLYSCSLRGSADGRIVVEALPVD